MVSLEEVLVKHSFPFCLKKNRSVQGVWGLYKTASVHQKDTPKWMTVTQLVSHWWRRDDSGKGQGGGRGGLQVTKDKLILFHEGWIKFFKKEEIGLPWRFSGQDCTPKAGGPGSTPGQGTICHKPQLRIHKLQLKIPRATNKTQGS